MAYLFRFVFNDNSWFARRGIIFFVIRHFTLLGVRSHCFRFWSLIEQVVQIYDVLAFSLALIRVTVAFCVTSTIFFAKLQRQWRKRNEERNKKMYWIGTNLLDFVYLALSNALIGKSLKWFIVWLLNWKYLRFTCYRFFVTLAWNRWENRVFIIFGGSYGCEIESQTKTICESARINCENEPFHCAPVKSPVSISHWSCSLWPHNRIACLLIHAVCAENAFTITPSARTNRNNYVLLAQY